MKRSPLAASAALLALAATSLVAQQPAGSYLEVGVEPVAVVTRPLGTLESVRGAEPCGEVYEGSTRVNPGILGVIAWVLDGTSHPFGTVGLRALRLSAGYEDLSSDWMSPAERYPAYDDAAGRYTEIESQFTAGYTLRYLRMALDAEATLGANLALRAGPSVAVPMSASAEQSEAILSPSGATFADATQERTIAEATGEIDDAGVRVGLGATLAYRLPLGRRLFFEPMAGVDVALTSVQPDWSPLEARLGIALGYALFADAEPIVAAPKEPEPVRAEPVRFAASVDVRLADPGPIELRRQIVARYTPVIPVVFFERDVGTLAPRYRALSSRAGFSESTIATEADVAHLDVLNVLGSRLAASRATVTLTGTTSEDESDREALARQRAETVASYLENTWGIDRSRIALRSRLAPAVPTSGATEDGREENRRVEIAVSDDALLAPVQQRTVEPVGEPRAIAFRPEITANKPIERWRLRIGESSIDGAGAPPQVITWELTQEERERLLAGGSSAFRLEVETAGGESAQGDGGTIPLHLDTTVTVATSATRPDNAAEFLLITFEFDQARLTERGRRELETITGRIAPASRVEVTGYTDRIGEAERNRTLARERAGKVAALLPRAAALEVRGADQSDAPYTNDTPEGRFLSRTVRVVIADPR